jgi:hypothetical protein
MATATEAPASTTAEGPTPHTQNQAPGLSPYQLRMLHGGINPNRVRNLRGLSHLEAWDVRRQLIRVFGFGGFSIETLSLDLVHNHGQEGFRKKNKQGEYYGDPYTAWTVVYRAQVRLTIFDTSGREISHWEDGAAGDAVNQPSVGDAHDMAMKTSLSQAVKRCATNLGDQFGLSLYNDGSRDAVVGFSAAHPPQEWKQVAPPQPEPEDPPVQGEPDAGADAEESVPSAAAPTAEQREDVHRQEQAAGTTLEGLKEKINAGWKNRLSCEQNLADARKHGLLDETVKVGEMDVRVEDLLTRRIAQLKEQAAQANATEGQAA